jgi:formate/nitrite transporter FocA (FNT family)
VPVFILSGFEHCIADAFYFSLTENVVFSKLIIFVLIATFGNSIGGLIFPYIREKF